MPEIPLPDPPLNDGEVALRPWRHADLLPLVKACQDPDIPRWTAVPSPYGEPDAREYLARAEVDRRSGRELGLAVVASSRGGLLGGGDGPPARSRLASHRAPLPVGPHCAADGAGGAAGQPPERGISAPG